MTTTDCQSPGRRIFISNALAGAGLLLMAPQKALSAVEVLVPNVTGLYPVSVARVATPFGTQDVCRAIREWPGKVAVGGGRYSMGGQTAITAGLQLDMRGMNRLIWLDQATRRVRVQAGRRWRDLQDIINPTAS